MAGHSGSPDRPNFAVLHNSPTGWRETLWSQATSGLPLAWLRGSEGQEVVFALELGCLSEGHVTSQKA